MMKKMRTVVTSAGGHVRDLLGRDRRELAVLYLDQGVGYMHVHSSQISSEI